jgi:ADP-ribose pyrophosphatase YjhB (NUDIX family)
MWNFFRMKESGPQRPFKGQDRLERAAANGKLHVTATNPGESTLTDFTATLPRKRMGAGALFTDQAGQALLVKPIYKREWEVPGGAVEADESPRAATAREIEEELGLVVTPGRLLVVDWVPARDGRTEGLMLVFDGGVLTPAQTGTIRLPADELRSWAWCDQQQAEQRLSGLLARRVAAALEARVEGATAYLEDGHR